MGGMFSGGSSNKPVKQQVEQTTTNIPSYAKPYYTRMLGRAEAVSNQAYTPYTGQRIASFNDDQNAYFSGIRSLAQRGGLDDPSMIGRFMNPYIENVLNRQKMRAQQLYGEQQSERDWQAISRDAFGGSGRYVRDQMAQEAMNRQLADIDAQGLYDAWNNATGLAQLDQQMAAERLGLLQTSGAEQQKRQQASLDAQYAEFERQQNWEKDQLNFMSGIMASNPYAKPSTTTTGYSPAPNAASQIAGSATGIAGLAKAGVV